MSEVTPENIMRLGLGFWASKTLLSAVELGVFKTLASGPAEPAALQTALGLHPRSARDFLDALVALGMLERENGTYRNSAETDFFLDPRKLSYIGGFLEMLNARLYEFWGSHRGAANRRESKRGKARGRLLQGALCRSAAAARLPWFYERAKRGRSACNCGQISVERLQHLR